VLDPVPNRFPYELVTGQGECQLRVGGPPPHVPGARHDSQGQVQEDEDGDGFGDAPDRTRPPGGPGRPLEPLYPSSVGLL